MPTPKISDVKKDLEVTSLVRNAEYAYKLYSRRKNAPKILFIEKFHPSPKDFTPLSEKNLLTEQEASWLIEYLKRLREKKQSLQILYAYWASKKNTNTLIRIGYSIRYMFTTNFTKENSMGLILALSFSSIPLLPFLMVGIFGVVGGFFIATATGIGFLVAAALWIAAIVGFLIYFRKNLREDRSKIQRQGYIKKLFDIHKDFHPIKKMMKMLNEEIKKEPKEPSPNLAQQKNPESDNTKKAKSIQHFLHQCRIHKKIFSYKFKFSIPKTPEEKQNIKKIIEYIERITRKKIKIHWKKSPPNAPTLEGHFTLTSYKASTLREHLAKTFDPKTKLGEEYYVKTIRPDEKDYFASSFIYGITRSLQQKFKFLLRTGEQKNYAVDGTGIKKRDTHIDKVKPEPEKYKGPHPFSQSQPTSYNFNKYTSKLFYFRNGINIVSGVAISAKDVFVSNYVSIYDGGTVDNDNHFNSKSAAQTFYDDNVAVNPVHERILYQRNEKETFQETLKNDDHPTHYGLDHNEVLAGIRWNTDGSSFLIMGSDNFETRILTLYRAKILLERLKKQAEENNEPWDPETEIPICFYSKKYFGKREHLSLYDVFEQKEDLERVKKIAKNQSLREDKYKNNDHEFLLMVSDEAANEIYQKDTGLIEDLLNKEKLSVLFPFLQKLNKKNLMDLFSDNKLHYFNLPSKICKHFHSFSPSFVEHLIKLGIHKENLHYQKFVCELAAINGMTKVIEKEFFNPENEKNHAALFTSLISTRFGINNTSNQFLADRFRETMNCDAITAFIINHNYTRRTYPKSEWHALDRLMLNQHFLQKISDDIFNTAWKAILKNKNFFYIKHFISTKKSQAMLDEGLAFMLNEPKDDNRETVIRLLFYNGADINSKAVVPVLDKAITACIDNHLREPLLNLINREDFLSLDFVDRELPKTLFDIPDDFFNDSIFNRDNIDYAKLVEFFIKIGKHKALIKAFEGMTKNSGAECGQKMLDIYSRCYFEDFYNKNTKITAFSESWRLLLHVYHMWNNTNRFSLEIMNHLPTSELELLGKHFEASDTSVNSEVKFYTWAFDQLRPSRLQSIKVPTIDPVPKNNIKIALKVLDKVLHYIDLPDSDKVEIKNRTLEKLCKSTAELFRLREKSADPFLSSPKVYQTYTYSR